MKIRQPQKPFPNLILGCIFVIIMGVTASCNDATTPETPTPSQPGNRADYDSFSTENGLDNWDAFANPVEDEDTQVGEPEAREPEIIGAVGDKVQYDCTVTPFSLTRTPREIVTFSPDANKLFPGALLQGRGHLLGLGSLRELPIRQRAPLTLSIDLLNSDNSRTVQNPTNATVQQAIGELVSKAEASGLKAGSDIFFNQKESHSVEEVALALDVSARYNAFSGSTSFNFDRAVDETTVTAYYVQKMFTVSITQPQTPADWFSGAFTQEVLDEQVEAGNIGPNNLPVYVSSVTFGRVLMFHFTSKGTEQEIKATLNAAFNGAVAEVDANLSAAQKKLLQEAEIQVVTIGGEGKNASAIIRSGNLKDYFESEAALTSAKPISYIINNLGDNSIAKVSETTNYNVTECTASPVAAKVIGERVVVSLVDVEIIEAFDCCSAADIFGSFRLNGELAWEITKSNARQIDSGATITFADDIPATRVGKEKVVFNCLSDAATPCSFTVEGDLLDDDDNTDDIIGDFTVPFFVPPSPFLPGFPDGIEVYPFAVYPFGYGIHEIGYDGRDDGNGASTLRLKIEKLCDILEGNGNGCADRPIPSF